MTMGVHVEPPNNIVDGGGRKKVVRVVVPDASLEENLRSTWSPKPDFCFCFVAPESKSADFVPLPGEIEWPEDRSVCAFGYPMRLHDSEISRCFLPAAVANWISDEENSQRAFVEEIKEIETEEEVKTTTEDKEANQEQRVPSTVPKASQRRRSTFSMEGHRKKKKKKQKKRDKEEEREIERSRALLRAHWLTFGGYHQLVTSVGVFAPSFPLSLLSDAVADARVTAAPGMSGGAVCVATQGQMQPVGLMLGSFTEQDFNQVMIFAASPAFLSAFCFLIPESDEWSRGFLAFAKNALKTTTSWKTPYFENYVPSVSPLFEQTTTNGPEMLFLHKELKKTTQQTE